MRRVGARPPYGQPDSRPARYYVSCKRSSSRVPCIAEIEVYKVVTGSHAVEATHGQGSYQVEDVVYYWPDTAIVLHTATEYSTRELQVPFCSHRCLSLWSAKVDRDTRE